MSRLTAHLAPGGRNLRATIISAPTHLKPRAPMGFFYSGTTGSLDISLTLATTFSAQIAFASLLIK
jgi:hypothetical protein